MTQYIILDQNDVTRLVCEENVVVKGISCDIVVCTEEYFQKVISEEN